MASETLFCFVSWCRLKAGFGEVDSPILSPGSSLRDPMAM